MQVKCNYCYFLPQKKAYLLFTLIFYHQYYIISGLVSVITDVTVFSFVHLLSTNPKLLSKRAGKVRGWLAKC